MRRPVLAAFVLGLAAGSAGCGDTHEASVPIRLVADPGIRRDAPFLSWGTVVTIANVARPVLSAAAPVLPPTEVRLNPNGKRTVGAQIPPEFSALPWLVFETVVTRGGTMQMMRSWPVTAKLAGTKYDVWVDDDKVGPDGTPAIRLWPVPDLATRDVETGEIAVPAHAALQVGVGVEPISWDTTVFPIDMTVAVVDRGVNTVLETIRLDVRRPENKKWVDASIPLDAFAGRRVRFRFSARPSAGPTAAVSLPLWADPTIVDARANPTGAH